MFDFEIIACDFDGTLFEEDWPRIGAPNMRLIHHLIRKQQRGAKIVLWTCREGIYLEQAVSACQEKGLIFDRVNENVPEVIEAFDCESRKIFAHKYIDDRMCRKFNLPYIKNYKRRMARIWNLLKF